MSDSSIDAEALFAQLAVQQGLAKPEHVKECLEHLRELASRNVAPLPRLAELLSQRGYLNLEQFQRTIRIEETKPAPPATRPAHVPEGERYGKYVRTVKLGEGGMGEVWKAWDTELNRWVAIKFLKGGDSAEVGRFRREAQVAARLEHPNIAAIYEATDSYIVMQFVEGINLTKLPRDDQRLIAEVLRQSALAVQYAHEQKVIHRDIKPHNIMVQGLKQESGTPRPFRVYVMDFGLAKQTSVDSSVSVSGSVVGTPAYMSPEQTQGSGGVDDRTDVYSLGATLYELLAGVPPVSGSNVYEILRKVTDEEPYPIFKANPFVERDLETITMKCLEKDPARRYATAKDLADDLARFLAGDLIQARPVSRSERLIRSLKRHKGIVIPTAAAAVLGIVLLGVLLVRSRLDSSKFHDAVAAARELEKRATGSRRERRDALLKARDQLDRALEIDENSPEARIIYGRVVAELERLLSEEDKDLVLAENREHLAALMNKWLRLRETFWALEAIHHDSTLSAEERRARAAPFWPQIQAVIDGTEDHPTPRATTRAFAGWARRLSGHEEEGLRWMKEASTLDPYVGYGVLFEALILFNDHVLSRSASPPDRIAAIVRELDGTHVWDLQSEPGFLAIRDGLHAAIDGKLAQAEARFSEAIQAPSTDPFNGDLYIARGALRLRLKNVPGALEDLKTAVTYREKNAPLRAFLAAALSGDDALREFDEALKLDPRYWPALAGRGAELEKQGRFREAADAYEAALKIAPEEVPLTESLRRVREKTPK